MPNYSHGTKLTLAQVEEPPYLSVGTDVSAKYKGAFCEAKIIDVNKHVKLRVLFDGSSGSYLIDDTDLKAGSQLETGTKIEARHPEKKQQTFLQATVTKILDHSRYTVVFDDGDQCVLRRNSLCLKSGKHFAESETLDQLPLTNPEHFGNPVKVGAVEQHLNNHQQAANSVSLNNNSSSSSNNNNNGANNNYNSNHANNNETAQSNSSGAGNSIKATPSSNNIRQENERTKSKISTTSTITAPSATVAGGRRGAKGGRKRRESVNNGSKHVPEPDELNADSSQESADVDIGESNVKFDLIEPGIKLMVRYGKGKVQNVYEAKVNKIETNSTGKTRYFVHYTGWNNRYDEWITKNRVLSIVTDKENGGTRDGRSRHAPDSAASNSSSAYKATESANAVSSNPSGPSNLHSTKEKDKDREKEVPSKTRRSRQSEIAQQATSASSSSSSATNVANIPSTQTNPKEKERERDKEASPKTRRSRHVETSLATTPVTSSSSSSSATSTSTSVSSSSSLSSSSTTIVPATTATPTASTKTTTTNSTKERDRERETPLKGRRARQQQAENTAANNLSTAPVKINTAPLSTPVSTPSSTISISTTSASTTTTTTTAVAATTSSSAVTQLYTDPVRVGDKDFVDEPPVKKRRSTKASINLRDVKQNAQVSSTSSDEECKKAVAKSNNSALSSAGSADDSSQDNDQSDQVGLHTRRGVANKLEIKTTNNSSSVKQVAPDEQKTQATALEASAVRLSPPQAFDSQHPKQTSKTSSGGNAPTADNATPSMPTASETSATVVSMPVVLAQSAPKDTTNNSSNLSSNSNKFSESTERKAHQTATAAICTEKISTTLSTSTNISTSPSTRPVYKFCEDIDEPDCDKKISILQDRIMELRQTYMSLKTELADLDRRRKRPKTERSNSEHLNCNSVTCRN